MINHAQHKPVVAYSSIQVIFPYEILEARNASTGEFLWIEVRFIGQTNGKPVPPKPFLKESEARDHIVSEITHKENAHK